MRDASLNKIAHLTTFCKGRYRATAPLLQSVNMNDFLLDLVL